MGAIIHIIRVDKTDFIDVENYLNLRSKTGINPLKKPNNQIQQTTNKT